MSSKKINRLHLNSTRNFFQKIRHKRDKKEALKWLHKLLRIHCVDLDGLPRTIEVGNTEGWIVNKLSYENKPSKFTIFPSFDQGLYPPYCFDASFDDEIGIYDRYSYFVEDHREDAKYYASSSHYNLKLLPVFRLPSQQFLEANTTKLFEQNIDNHNELYSVCLSKTTAPLPGQVYTRLYPVMLPYLQWVQKDCRNTMNALFNPQSNVVNLLPLEVRLYIMRLVRDAFILQDARL